MKFLAFLLTACILFLSSFGGLVSMYNGAAKMPCGKTACEQMCRHNKKQAPANGCDGTSCPMMFSCSICGFIPATLTAALKTVFYSVDKPATPYKMGALSEYHAPGWQPPEVYA